MSELNISNSLRKLRFNHGEITQAKLAEIVGVTRQTIIALEAGRYTPTLELALKLSTVFDTSVDKVFFWSDETLAKQLYRNKDD